MTAYHFDALRRTKLDGAEFDPAQIGGEIPAETAMEAWSTVVSLIPKHLHGQWYIRMRCGRRHLRTRTYDVYGEGGHSRVS